MHQSKSNRVRLVDGHIPDSWILLAIDKEISCEDCEFVEEHLCSCSQCRSVEQRIRATIDQLREYNRVIVDSPASLSSSHHLAFEGKLHSLADQLASRRQFRFPTASATVRYIWNLFATRERILACGMILLIAAFAAYRFNVPAVSAKEMLIRSEAYEQDSLRGINDPIIVQKVRISAGGHHSERILYRDLKHNRHVHQVNGNSEEDRLVDGVLQQASLDTDELIVPELFLRASGERISATVAVRQSDKDTVVLAIHLPGYSITDADLTLRSADYHTIGARLRLSDQSTIQISELSYQVVQIGALRTGLFDLPRQETPAVLMKNVPANAVSDLANSEISALSILHNIHAELGGEISIDDSNPISVTIEGVVEDLARKQEIERALRGIPAVQMNIETVAQKRTSMHAQVYESPGALSATSVPPLLDKQLKEWFPAPEDRREYVRGVLSYGQSAASHAWVLDELSNHFPRARWMALRPKERKDLNSLLREEANSLSEDLDGLKRQDDMILVEPVVGASSTTPAYDKPEEVLLRDDSADWNDQVRRIHFTLDRVSDHLSALIVGAGAGARSTSSDRLRFETYQTLSELSMDVQRFRRCLAQ
jgi:hypothetical protein